MLKTTALQASLVVSSCFGFSFLQPQPEAFAVRSASAATVPNADFDCAACALDSAGTEMPADERPAHAADCIKPLLGTWQLNDKGLRTITVNPDGTATMDVKIDSIASFIYGRHLSMDLAWTMSDGVLSYSIVGGHPDRTVGRVVNNFGKDFQYRIMSMTDEAIALEDLADPGNVYVWANVETAVGDHG